MSVSRPFKIRQQHCLRMLISNLHDRSRAMIEQWRAADGTVVADFNLKSGLSTEH
jgi:hypothetical protein